MPETTALAYAWRQEKRQGTTRDLPFGPADLTWVANRVTLLTGGTEAMLIDTFTTGEQNERLVAWIAASGYRLTTVFVTHGHGDHFFGLTQLHAAFPAARILARPGAIEEARQQASPAYRATFWDRLFPGQIPDQQVFPDAFTGAALELEGVAVEILDTGFTDTRDTSAVWVPSLGLIAAGDVGYDRNHLYTAETTRATRAEWAASADRLADLEPTVVITGHGAGDEPAGAESLRETADYLETFNLLDAQTATAEELYARMLERYPRWLNPGALWGGAKASKPEG